MKYVLFLLIAIVGLTACTTQGVTPTPTPSTNTNSPQTVKPSSTNTSKINTAQWKEHTVPAVGIKFKLPPSLNFLGEVKQEIVAGETGTQLCIQFTKPTAWYLRFIPEAEAGGGCSTAPNSYIYMGTTSTDYAAGREGSFTDIQGFAKQNGKYLIRFVDGKFLETFDQDQIIPVDNPNGVEVIKVTSRLYPDEGPSLRNALGGRVGGIVNTRNKTYPGFDFIFENSLSADEIDGILTSIRFQ